MGDTREKKTSQRPGTPGPRLQGNKAKSLLARHEKPMKKQVTGVPSRQVLSTGPRIEKRKEKYSRKSGPQRVSGIVALPQEKSRKTRTKRAIPLKDTIDTRESPASGQYAFSASALGEKIHLLLGPCGSALRASENVGQRPFLPLSVV